MHHLPERRQHRLRRAGPRAREVEGDQDQDLGQHRSLPQEQREQGRDHPDREAVEHPDPDHRRDLAEVDTEVDEEADHREAEDRHEQRGAGRRREQGLHSRPRDRLADRGDAEERADRADDQEEEEDGASGIVGGQRSDVLDRRRRAELRRGLVTHLLHDGGGEASASRGDHRGDGRAVDDHGSDRVAIGDRLPRLLGGVGPARIEGTLRALLERIGELVGDLRRARERDRQVVGHRRVPGADVGEAECHEEEQRHRDHRDEAGAQRRRPRGVHGSWRGDDIEVVLGHRQVDARSAGGRSWLGRAHRRTPSPVVVDSLAVIDRRVTSASSGSSSSPSTTTVSMRA
ncbi:hypothetical protein ACH61_00708 [Rathayibacter tanaceti]|uniref:Uncharacterized protein n=1 Tax=Rathayibacter tanaceti TaxID=1671680 RepID=A0A166ICA6_9MICO|nr:hypothetical protein ACH61_00708 [Rathayibacter tanaceti]